MSDLLKIKRKIAALIAKAEGTDNEHEAETFMAKALELLQQYNLERSQLDPSEWEDPMGHEDEVQRWQVNNSWHRDLFGAVAKFYGCAVVFYTWRTGGKATLYGRESARETVKAMYPIIVKQLRKKAKLLVDGVHIRNNRMSERRMARSLTRRIWELNATYGSKDHTSKEAGLILQNELKTYEQKEWGKLESIKSGPKINNTAANVLAKQIDISQGVERQTRKLT